MGGKKNIINTDISESFFTRGANHLPPAYQAGSALVTLGEASELAGAMHPNARLLRSIRDEGLWGAWGTELLMGLPTSNVCAPPRCRPWGRKQKVVGSGSRKKVTREYEAGCVVKKQKCEA